MTLEETEEALRFARQEKYYRVKRDQYWEQIKSRIDWKVPTARELYEALRGTNSQTGKHFQVVDWNKKVIEDLCCYFAGDPEFEKRGEGYSLQKGIFISGPYGVGKSHLMAFFQKNPLASYLNITCKLVAERYRDDWSRDGMNCLQWYSYPAKAEAGHVYDQEVLGYCFNDFGTEEIKNSYGNALNVMETVIFQRYENRLPFNQTHITTNMDGEQIGKKYGGRIRDRIKEMCNILTLNGKSWRE